MQQLKKVINNVLNEGHVKQTRAGTVIGKFMETMDFDLTQGYPAVTTKKLAFKSMIGELLWMLAGKTDLVSLREYSGLDEDTWTIWSDDCKRWHSSGEGFGADVELGPIYGEQWRDFSDGFEPGKDQIKQVIESLKYDPFGRRHIVTAWNPLELENMALPPCHYAMQFYVRPNKHGVPYLDMVWHQRSVDTFLGLPFNIASYAALVHIMAKLTGYLPGKLHATLGDVHIYEQHISQCKELLSRKCLALPELVMPEFTTLHELLKFTANDFSLSGYENHGKLEGKLSVGK